MTNFSISGKHIIDSGNVDGVIFRPGYSNKRLVSSITKQK